MERIITILLVLVSMNVFSQVDLQKTAQEITDEGKLLYRLEVASWYGTDIFFDSFKERERVGGYFSYIDNGTPKCLFFTKGTNPRVVGVVSFGDIQLVETATIDFKERDFKRNEKELHTIRTKALSEIQQSSFFKKYSNTNLNLIPVISNGQKKVYVLTGPKNTGVVLFGNDYLLTFGKNNDLLKKKALHQNLIPIEYDDEKEAVASVHSHAPGTDDFITPTDICTLMLYAKYAKWKQHIVMSDKYISIWDCEKELLVIMTKDDFEKIQSNKL